MALALVGLAVDRDWNSDRLLGLLQPLPQGRAALARIGAPHGHPQRLLGAHQDALNTSRL